jgi:hypothetical protein
VLQVPDIATKTVDDPFDPRGRLRVDVNLRASVTEWMRHRDKISAAHLAVCERYKRLHDAVSLSTLRAVNPVKSDGASFDLERLLLIKADAIREMTQVDDRLSATSAAMLRLLVGHEKPLAEVAGYYARSKGCGVTKAQNYVAERFGEAVDDLGVLWGALEAHGPRWSLGPISARGIALVRGALNRDDEIREFDLREKGLREKEPT